ncbi:MAG: hypothetical protein RL235_857 [Chlamydiota bacterium]|jgi:predicted nucleic acid-binding protein
MLLLVSDANILIDIEDGGLASVVFRLPYVIAVPDILFELELRERHHQLLAAGLQVRSLTPDSIKKTEALITQYKRPSVMDHSALALAIQEQCPLLTGDKHLRFAAQQENVAVHGTIWIVEQLLHQRLVHSQQAKASFDAMKIKGSRLPWADADQLISGFSND